MRRHARLVGGVLATIAISIAMIAIASHSPAADSLRVQEARGGAVSRWRRPVDLIMSRLPFARLAGNNDPERPFDATPMRSNAMVGRAGPSLAYALSVGDRLTYKFTYASDVTLNLASLVPSATTADASSGLVTTLGVTSEGVLELVVSSATSVGVELLVRFPAVTLQFTTAGQEYPVGPDSPVLAALGRPVIVGMQRDGTLSDLRFAQGYPEEAVAVARGLLAAFQTPIAPADRWDTLEDDVTGRYRARYQLQNWSLDAGGASIARVLKTKVSYSQLYYRLTRVGDAAEVDARVRGTTSFLFDATRGHVVSVEGDDAVTLLVGGAEPVTSHSRARFALTVRDRVDDAHGMRPGAVQQVAASWVPAEHQEDASDEPPSIDSSLALLKHQLASAPELSFENIDVLRQLTAAIGRARSQADLAPVIDALRSGNPETATLLAGALGSAGTPAAQEGLAQIIADGTASAEARKAAAVGLAQTAEPTSGAEAAVRRVVASPSRPDDGTWEQSALALGAMGGRLRDSDSARGDNIVAALHDAGRSALSDGERIAWLKAVGNAGAAASLSEIVPFLSTRDDEVRAAAVSATRRIRDPTVDQQVTRMLEEDASATVRAASIRVLAEREARVAFDAVAQSAASDASPQVRRESIDFFSRFISEGGQPLAVIRAAQLDSDDAVRQLAAAVLARDRHER